MAEKIKEVKRESIPQAYEWIRGEFVPEVQSYVVTLKHKVSGARVLVMSNEDENKVFNIGFRTPPGDDTGVPHIIEHTVLCGSKNFPAKDPFVELVKGSLNTFLNATTYPDKTMYPVASCNDKDFANLMHVYLDAVFYPNIYRYEEIFKQEGWHYDLQDKDAPIIYNGVVYNEMKGAFSSEESVLERLVMKGLFPDNTYGHESGGDPLCIPDLTYEQYLNFHRTYYHPSNSYICLYGDMDVAERLRFIDENYLKNFTAAPVDSAIPRQKPFAAMKDITDTYPVAQDADCTEKTYYAFAAAMDITLDQNLCRAFDLLAYVLVEMPGAPLKQALLDAGIGSDIDVDFCDILRQSYFCLSAKNARAGKKQEFYRIVRETLSGLVKNGIDKKALEAAINGTEFREREADFGSFPKGLYYCIGAFKTWLYDDERPYDALRYEDCYRFLREQLNTDYYEKLIQEYLLDNPHAILLEMAPEPGLAVKREQQTAQKLAAYKESLSEKEIEKLIADTKALKEYQETPTPKEILEKIPMLKREEIGKKVQPYYNQERDIAGIKTVFHEIPTNGIIYLKMYFAADAVADYMPQLGFLTTLLGYMNTKKHTYAEFDTQVNLYTGGISADTGIYCKNGNGNDILLEFEARTKVLTDHIGQALDLIAEMLFETLFDDEKHLREVVAETRSRQKVQMQTAGHRTAAGRASSYFSKSAWYSDRAAGIGYYDYLVQLDEHFDEEKDRLKAGCSALLLRLLDKKNLLLSVTGQEKDFAAAKKPMEEFAKRLDAFAKQAVKEEADKAMRAMQSFVPGFTAAREAFATPAEIQYVAVAGSFADVPAKFGVLRVVTHLLNYDYLWNEVRVKGGAYGVGCRFNREGEGYLSSFRDPNLSATIKVYQKAAEYLENYNAQEREITKTVIGTISGMDTPLTPNMKGNRSMQGYLTGITEQMLQQERDQILACTAKDIRAAAPVLAAVADQTNLCVIGSESKIAEEKELFGSVVALS